MTDALDHRLRRAADERGSELDPLPPAAVLARAGERRRRRVLSSRAGVGASLLGAGVAAAVVVPLVREPPTPTRLAPAGSTPSPSWARGAAPGPPGQRYLRALQSCLVDGGLVVRGDRADWSVTTTGASDAPSLYASCRSSLQHLEQAEPTLTTAWSSFAEYACLRIAGVAVTIGHGPDPAPAVPAPPPLSSGAPGAHVPGVGLGVSWPMPPGMTDGELQALEQVCLNADR